MDEKYALDMVKFIDKIIRYRILEKKSDYIIDKAPSTFSNKTDYEFLLKLEENNNCIAAKT